MDILLSQNSKMVALLNKNPNIINSSPNSSFQNNFKFDDNLNQLTITSTSEIDVIDSSSKEMEMNQSKIPTLKEEKVLNGKWLPEENKRFLEGVAIYGSNWKLIQKHLQTRTLRQARSHAQKIVLKVKSQHIFENIEHIHNIQDLIFLIKQKPNNQTKEDIKSILHLLNDDIRLNKKQKKTLNKKLYLFTIQSYDSL